MKILLIQENGHHNKNRIYRECFSWQRAFQEYDTISTTIWGNRHANFNEKPDFNKFDVIICLENYDNGWVPHEEIANSKAKKYIWAVDSHCLGVDFFKNIKKRGKYNTILYSIKHHVSDNDVWFPNAYDSFLIKPIITPKKTFIGFCGNRGTDERFKCLLFLKEKIKDFIFDEFVIGDDMLKTINSYELHFNFNISDDINYRNFETVGCGVPLLTNYNYQYDELGFKDNVNCILYNNKHELIEKINFFKNNKTELNNISINGLELSKKHTYVSRIASLIKHIQQ